MAQDRDIFLAPPKVRPLVGALGIALLLTTAMPYSDAEAKRYVSRYCLSIDVEFNVTEPLLARFDGFAQRADLAIDTRHPLMRLYTTSDQSVMITLRNGMGKFGSIRSYVPLEGKAQSDLLDRLRLFVEEEIAPHYKTTLCEDIEGFSPPVLYN